MDIDLTRGLGRNAQVIHMQCDGITQEASLTQSEANINCLNWTVGHIVDSRNDLLTALGAGLPDDLDLTAYQRESEPITGPGPGVVHLSDLLDALDRSQARLADVIASIDGARWSEPLEERPDRTLADRAAFLLFHDTYHTGQTELLRQISGANDKVI